MRTYTHTTEGKRQAGGNLADHGFASGHHVGQIGRVMQALDIKLNMLGRPVLLRYVPLTTWALACIDGLALVLAAAASQWNAHPFRCLKMR